MEVSLEEAANGKDAQIRIPSWDKCDTCNGSGAKPVRGDLGVRDGKIAEMGKGLGAAKETVKADGNIKLVVKEFPILGQPSVTASKAALAARKLTIRDVLHILSWHEAHHHGQAHLTLNLYRAAHA